MSGQTFLNYQQSPELDWKPAGNLFDGGFGGAFRSGGSGGDIERTWDAPGRITVSLSPDGTAIGSYSSNVFKLFRQVLDTDALERTVADAIQTWTQHTSLNMALIDDSGDAFGTNGLRQGDSRFGDIRIGAIPMGPEVYAVATPLDNGASGTWAGDILFNSNADFDSAEQILAVLVHELGHTLGMVHSDQPTDVMNPAVLNTELSASEVSILQSLYGSRQLDQYDVNPDQRNDTLAQATRIKNPGSFDGTVPLIAFGDLESASDVDFFELRSLGDYQGTVTFRVVSSGISLLAPAITVLNEQGQVLDSVTSSSLRGDDLSITIAAPLDEAMFVRIHSAEVAGHRFGSYSLLTTIDDNVILDPQQIEHVIVQDYWNLDQSDIHTLFTEPEPLFNDDLHTNDTLSSATALDEVAGSLAGGRFRIQAGISDTLDRDFYSVTSPDFPPGTATLTASLVSLEQRGLVADMEFFDEAGQPLDKRIIARGNGRFVVQIDGVLPESDYFVSIAADRPGQAFDTGNYTLDVSFDRQPFQFDEMGGGYLSPVKNTRSHSLYVAETQMFHLGISAGPNEALTDAIVWLSVFNSDGHLVWRTATRPGEFRTADSIILQPGSYSIRADLVAPGINNPSENNDGFKYRILGKNISDPMGPELVNPATMPFPRCDPLTGEFCYPGDRQTTDPFILVDGGEVSVPTTGGTTNPDISDANDWFWYQNWQENNG